MYKYDGRLTWLEPPHAQEPLTASQLLLRGTTLRNTAMVFALVVYTGPDTRVALNQQKPLGKFTKLEATLNYIIAAIFVVQCALAVICAAMGVSWKVNHGDYMPYLMLTHSVGSDYSLGLSSLFTFLVLFNMLIPISLIVSAEMTKWAAALFIDNDPRIEARARSSELVEDLGQVQFVLTDKTGTLTDNVMKFKKASIGTLP